MPIVRRKLADGIVDRLLLLIESGDISPGERLPSEREMMNIYRVGRPAIREALQSLQQMGMISISHGERARSISLTPSSIFAQIGNTARYLVSTSPETLEHLKKARLMFEQAMVQLAARKATDHDIAQLRATLDTLASAGHETAEFIRADILFHETIAGISGNPLFAAISKAMLDWLTRFSVRTVYQPGAANLTLSEHQEILNSIQAHDEARAEQAVARHLLRAHELYHRAKP